jgi:hypothetical protein
MMLCAMTRVLRNEGKPTDAPVLSRTVLDARNTLGLPPTSPLPEDLLREASRARTPPLPDSESS